MHMTISPGSRSFWHRFSIRDLNDPRVTAASRVWIPILFGLWSVLLGQDSNWDSLNYHQYNGFALLHHKLLIDFAPAGFQSYFNPALDVFYYGLNQLLPAPAVGFVMGALHGLNFILLLAITRRSLLDLPAEDRNRSPLLLAIAGILTANFLSGLGNSMGDDTTTLFVLASLFLVLRRLQGLAGMSVGTVVTLIGAGILAGLGTGLKLTNATFAIALCSGLLLMPASPSARIRAACLFAVGALAGLLAASGNWMEVMWHTFGNPLFPQFSVIFPNPLTPAGGISDTSWLPKSIFEYLFWPFVFALDSNRVGQVHIHQVIWPIVYVLFWILAATRLIDLIRGRDQRQRLNLRARYVVAFVAFGYILWMMVFSIYRYIVPIETLTPLVAYLLLARLLPYLVARRVAAWVLGACTLVVVAGGVNTWGHASWAWRVPHADVPVLKSPERTTVVFVGGDPPWAWLAQFFAPTVAFTQIGGNFPFTPLFDQRIADMIHSRGGPTYAVIQGRVNWRVDNVAKLDRIVAEVGLSHSAQSCHAMQSVIDRVHLHASIRWTPGAADQRACRLDLRPDDMLDITGENAQLVEQARPMLARHGFNLDASTCATFRAYVGKKVVPYQWCRIARGDASPPRR